MKIIKYVIIITTICSFLSAQEAEEALAEKIKQISEELLEGYTQPVITAFGTGISTGLFHSAYSHDFLGFDLGVRIMYIQLPSNAKYFRDTVVVCSLATDRLVYYDVELDSINTIFGPKDQTDVPTPGNAVGIPPYIPGGFNLSGVPLIMPQLNVGLLLGSELAIRYIPYTFKGSKVEFLGIGGKQELNRLPGINSVPLPVAIAIGGAYQTFSIKDTLGDDIINSRTWNFQVLLSKRMVAFEPLVGVGIEGTTVDFHYDFEYELPDTISGIPSDRIQVTEEVRATLHSQNHYRAILGFNLKLGFFYLHYDYNILPYMTHNVMCGLTVR